MRREEGALFWIEASHLCQESLPQHGLGGLASSCHPCNTYWSKKVQIQELKLFPALFSWAGFLQNFPWSWGACLPVTFLGARVLILWGYLESVRQHLCKDAGSTVQAVHETLVGRREKWFAYISTMYPWEKKAVSTMPMEWPHQGLGLAAVESASSWIKYVGAARGAGGSTCLVCQVLEHCSNVKFTCLVCS